MPLTQIRKEMKMRWYHISIGSNFITASLCLILWALAGCAVVGPSSISMGRASYNEAINKTEDEQLLASIVRSRYGELYSLLAVTGVAANVRFSTNAGGNLGATPDVAGQRETERLAHGSRSAPGIGAARSGRCDHGCQRGSGAQENLLAFHTSRLVG